MPTPYTNLFRYTYDDWFMDDPSWKEKELVGVDKEVNYVYLKGSGWVPETPNVKSLIAKKEREEQDRLFAERVQENIRRERERMRDARRMWFMDPPIPQQLPRNPAPERQWYTYRTAWNEPLRFTPVANTHDDLLWAQWPDEPEPTPAPAPDTRYFPGGGVAAEPRQEQETIHERRAREYREGLRRWRRR